MRPVAKGLAVAIVSFAVVACSGGAAGTQAPTQAASAGASQAAICAPSTAAGTVTGEAKEFKWVPESLTAKVGDVIVWTNADSAPHGVELDESGAKCTTNIAGGATGGATFGVAGTYAFHCFVHPNMKGTIVIS